jgi:cardiolipin synthase A/B
VFYGRAEIQWLAQWIEALIADAAPFNYRAPGLLRDLCEGLLLTVAYQL